MSRVEAFATGIKIESGNQSPFFLGGGGGGGGRSRDQGDLQTAKNQQSRMRGCNLTFDPSKSRDQEPPRERSSDQKT